MELTCSAACDAAVLAEVRDEAATRRTTGIKSPGYTGVSLLSAPKLHGIKPVRN